MRELMKRDISV